MKQLKRTTQRTAMIIALILIACMLTGFAGGSVTLTTSGGPAALLLPTTTPPPENPTTESAQVEEQLQPMQENLSTLTTQADTGTPTVSEVPADSEVRKDSMMIVGQIPENDGLKHAPEAPSGEPEKLVPLPDQEPTLPPPGEPSKPTESDPFAGPVAAVGWNTVLSEGFEGAFPAGAWSAYDNDGSTNGEYYWDDVSYTAYNGSWSGWPARGGANGVDPASYFYPNYAQSWMVYGPFDLSDANDAELLFSYWNQSEASFDWFGWYASVNGTNFYGSRVSGDSAGWRSVNFDLTAVPTLGNVTGDSSVWIAFIFTSDGSNVDDGPFVDSLLLQKYVPAGQANLTSYTPSGWDYPIVPSASTGTHAVSTLYADQYTYIDWAIINNGATSSTTFTSCLYFDNSQLQCWNTNGINQGYYAYVEDWLLSLSPTAGSHTLKIVADVNNNVSETNEGDNTWQRSFTWNGATQPNLTPYTPSGWDYPIVPSASTGTHTVSALASEQSTYIDWAIVNNGATTSTTFVSCLYFDNTQIQCWNSNGLNQNYYAFVEDWVLNLTPTAGSHTLKLVTDVNNNVTESNESDNTWQRAFTWTSSCPASSYSPQDLASLGLDGPSPLVNDVLSLPDPIRERQASPEAADPRSNLPGRYNTSVFMTGTVAVGIILPESTGSGENWTTAEQNCVVQKIQTGLDWWKTKGGTAANLSFVYDTHLGVSTTYEPITQPTSNQGLWIQQVMTNMGYTDSDYWEQVYSYVNYLRNQYHTDWAYVFIVADSSNDTDGKFPDGYFGYTYLGGPFVIMTYDNDGWGIDDMNWVATHETGHVFLAADQYYQAGYGGCTSTTQRYGYLGIANSNCQYNNPNSVPSIMRSNEDVLENTARGQIGWQDSNGNGVLDPIDTSPGFNLPPYSPDPSTQPVLTYTGYVYDTPWPHATCGNSDQCYSEDITLQKITSAQYRVDGGSWLNVTPADGALDSDFEQITFTTPSLSNGLHTIEVRAYNSKNRSSTWTDQVTVNSAYLLTVTKAGTGSGTVTSSPSGINCGADCSENYNHNTNVTLSATPAARSYFAGWSGACSGTGSCIVSMTAAKSVTATFNLQNYPLAVIKMGTGNGMVSSNPAGINCGADCSEFYAYNTVVALTASATSGSTFTGWTGGGCSGTGTCTVTMTADTTVTANFVAIPGLFNKISPPNGATGKPNNLTLSWGPSSGAGFYSYCYDTTNDGVCSPWVNNGASTSATLSGLSYSTTYFWHVRAANGAGVRYAENNSTAFWSFRTRSAPATLTFSATVDDGWVLESTETSNAGGTMNATQTTFNVGDAAGDKQYRSVISFNTASLPDNAVITAVTFKVMQQGVAGTNPFTTHGNLLLDIKTGAFGGSNALQLADFKAAANKTGMVIANTPAAGWYARSLPANALTFVNKAGVTQFRLRFTRDDNDDLAADLIRFFSGNAVATNRPKLIVQYYIP